MQRTEPSEMIDETRVASYALLQISGAFNLCVSIVQIASPRCSVSLVHICPFFPTGIVLRSIIGPYHYFDIYIYNVCFHVNSGLAVID